MVEDLTKTDRIREGRVKKIVCKWGQSSGFVLVSDVDYPVLREHSWHITEANASGKPYARTCIGTKTVYMHRAVVKCPPQYRVDHRDRDGLNNQRPNLRVASHDQNNYNREGWSFSGYKGVSMDRRRWRARITIDGIAKTLGRFDTAIEAAVAYDEAAHELFGEFAWFNFPETYPPPFPDKPVFEIPF